jgi:hypothetical protein
MPNPKAVRVHNFVRTLLPALMSGNTNKSSDVEKDITG